MISSGERILGNDLERIDGESQVIVLVEAGGKNRPHDPDSAVVVLKRYQDETLLLYICGNCCDHREIMEPPQKIIAHVVLLYCKRASG